MDITKLTSEQRAELKAQLDAEDKAAKAKVQQDREDYKHLVDAWVRSNVRKLQNFSSVLVKIHEEIFTDAETIIDEKNKLFKVKTDRQSDTFSTEDGTMSITLGNRINEGWDDTVNAGIAKVKEYLKTLARDANSAALVDTIMGLIAKDRNGNLKASKVLELEKLAIKTQDPVFLDGIAIIKAAYRPVPSCQFIEVTLKDEKGNEVKLPLSMAAINR